MIDLKSRERIAQDARMKMLVSQIQKLSDNGEQSEKSENIMELLQHVIDRLDMTNQILLYSTKILMQLGSTVEEKK